MSDARANPTAAPASTESFRAAVAAAVVSAAFCAVVGAQMLRAWQRTRVKDPLESPGMVRLKAAMRDDPRGETIKTQIRDLDLQLRREYFENSRLLTAGAFLLLGGAVILAASLKTAAALRARPPRPGPRQVDAGGMKAGRRGRWAVGALSVVMAAAAGALPLASRLPERDGAALEGPPAEGVWPRFRGPGGTGVAAYSNYPDTFNGWTGENILWKVPIPLPGKSSPIVWKDRVFVTGADKNRAEVYCLDALTGRRLWNKVVEGAAPAPGGQPLEPMDDTGFAAPTPVTDGKAVYAVFATGNVAAFDLFGNLLWLRKLGIPENEYGHAASLDMHEGLVLVQMDQGIEEDGKSRLYALDGRTGKTVWEAKRPVGSSWASPIVIPTDKGPQVVTCSNPWVIAYDPARGTELWRAKCLEGDGGPSPTFAGGRVLAVQASSMLAAIRPDGRGDVTETHLAWRGEDGLPDIASPVSNGKQVWLLTSGGMLTCYDLPGGAKLWEKDLKGEFISSPSIVGEKLLLISRTGNVTFLQAGPEFKELGSAVVGEKCETCPAFVDGRIYLRGEKNLYCIGRK